MRKVAKKTRFDTNASRTRHRDPAQVPFYSAKKPQIRVVSTGFNALKISDRQRFTLKAYGKPFNYSGVITKRYDITALGKIFFASNYSIYQWIKLGYLPAPMITVGKRRMWFYHQVQPFYVWYWHQRNKKLTLQKVSEAEYNYLVMLQRKADRRWYRLIGVEFPDPYRDIAGKYGVIYQKDGDN